jgi:arylsulfatase A
LRGRKGQTLEGGIRVPCIARWPGKIPADTICSEVAGTIDLLPTIAKLAGSQAPQDRIIDGKDIWPLLSNQQDAVSPHEAYYYYQKGQLQAVRSGKWKLFVPMASKIRSWGKPDGKTEAVLYNLSSDIHEDKNVAAENPQVVKRLLGLAAKAREDLGDMDQAGKNQRPAGMVDQGQPLLMQ